MIESRGVQVAVTDDRLIEVTTRDGSLAFTPGQWRWLTAVAGPSVELLLRDPPPTTGH
jgi:hypothetical protein